MANSNACRGIQRATLRGRAMFAMLCGDHWTMPYKVICSFVLDAASKGETSLGPFQGSLKVLTVGDRL